MGRKKLPDNRAKIVSYPASIPWWMAQDIGRRAPEDLRSPANLAGLLLIRGYLAWREDGKLFPVPAMPEEAGAELGPDDLARLPPDGTYVDGEAKKSGTG